MSPSCSTATRKSTWSRSLTGESESTHTQRFVFSFFREPADLVIQLYCSISHIRVLLRLDEHPDHIYWNFHLFFFFFSPLGSKRFWGFCCVVFHRGHGEPVSLLAGKYYHYISCRSTMCQDPDAAWPVLRSLVEGVTKNRGRESIVTFYLVFTQLRSFDRAAAFGLIRKLKPCLFTGSFIVYYVHVYLSDRSTRRTSKKCLKLTLFAFRCSAHIWPVMIPDWALLAVMLCVWSESGAPGSIVP